MQFFLPGWLGVHDYLSCYYMHYLAERWAKTQARLSYTVFSYIYAAFGDSKNYKMYINDGL